MFVWGEGVPYVPAKQPRCSAAMQKEAPAADAPARQARRIRQ
jgi:hypothetical protein